MREERGILRKEQREGEQNPCDMKTRGRQFRGRKGTSQEREGVLGKEDLIRAQYRMPHTHDNSIRKLTSLQVT